MAIATTFQSRPARAAALLGLILGTAASAAAQGAATDVRFTLHGESGQLIGQQSERIGATVDGQEILRQGESAFTVSGHDATEIDELWRLALEPDGAPQRWQWRRRVNGKLLSVELDRDGALLKGQVVNDGRRHPVAAAMPALPIGDPEALAPLLAEPAGAKKWSIAEFDPITLQFRAVEMRVAPRSGTGHGYVLTSTLGGRLQSVRRLTYKDGKLAEAKQALLGSSRSWRRDDGPPTSEKLLSRGRIVAHEQHKPGVHITQRAAMAQIRYAFGGLADIVFAFPETGEQRARREGDGWQVDICGDCGPAPAPTADEIARWTRPTSWIQSDDPAFRDKAAQARRMGKTDAAVMIRLGQVARTRLPRIEFEGYLSARTAWRRHAGDCTEDALVLAALGRAAGIPVRVAHGLVFSPGRYHGASNAYMPHSWVIAFVDGRWKSFDISLNGFDATHIALSLSDGEPEAMIEARQIAALLEWRAISEVRKPPDDP
jgi:hypothetical protein